MLLTINVFYSTCLLNHLSAEKFSAAFDPSAVLSSHADVASLVHSFNTHCSTVLDEGAPTKFIHLSV